jgi:cytoskeletal protein CcmA (bactofilin family)
VIAAAAVVEADLEVESVDIHGQVEGDVVATPRSPSTRAPA